MVCLTQYDPKSLGGRRGEEGIGSRFSGHRNDISNEI